MPQAFWESLAVPLKCQVPTCAMSCGVILLCHLEVVPRQCPRPVLALWMGPFLCP